MSTFLHKEIDGITGNLKGHRRNNGHVIHVDTEQGDWHAQQFGSASSYGKKYALGNLFLIDDTADADATNKHGMGNVSKKPELTGEALKKAMAFVKNGGDIKAIQAKYTILAENLKKLQQ
jgi:hypothetical protein